MAYVVIAHIVMAAGANPVHIYSYGLHRYGRHIYGLYSYGLCSYGQGTCLPRQVQIQFTRQGKPVKGTDCKATLKRDSATERSHSPGRCQLVIAI